MIRGASWPDHPEMFDSVQDVKVPRRNSPNSAHTVGVLAVTPSSQDLPKLPPRVSPRATAELVYGHPGTNMTKYEQNCDFFKMSMSENFRNVYLSEIQASAGAT